MNTIVELLQHMKSLGIKVWVDGSKLQYKTAEGPLPGSVREMLVERKQEIISFLQHIHFAADSGRDEITRFARTQRGIPVSFAQQRLWFLDSFEPGTSSYNMPSALRLSGRLDVPALERAIEAVIRRHEVLRTHFEMDGDQVVQVIDEPGAFSIEQTCLEGIPADEREEAARRICAEEAARPFDLSRGPLIRARLVRISEREYVLPFTMHHIAADGWSMGVLIKEVAALYTAYANSERLYALGQPTPLPELALQYADYAVWQRKWLQGGVLESQLDYWKKTLANLAPLRLPTDYPRAAINRYKGQTHTFAISADVIRRLKELGKRENATLFMTVFAAWAVFLADYCGQDDICVGSDVANRNSRDVEDMIGFFVNQIVLRLRLTGATSFVEVIRRARDVCHGAFQHQDLPFEQVVSALDAQGGLDRHPLFQVKLVLQNAPQTSISLQDLAIEWLATSSNTAKFDLLLNLYENEAGLAGALEYNTDLFHADSIAAMARRFETLLTIVADRPETRAGEIGVLIKGIDSHQKTEKAAALRSANQQSLRGLLNGGAERRRVVAVQ